MFAVNSLALFPIISFASFTSLPNNLDNSFATGSKEKSLFTCPFGLPKCEQRITLQSLSNKYFIVGRAPTILLLSVIFLFSSKGTLKSYKNFLSFNINVSNSLFIHGISSFLKL
jgi:hypothetical protein